MASSPPHRSAGVAGYEHLCDLSRGGMAEVSVVMRREGDFRRLYALKRLHGPLRDDDQVVAMFLDEARFAGMIRHAHVVSVLDLGQDEDGPFLVMDYIEGVGLDHLIRHHAEVGQPIPVQIALRIVSQVAQGLHAAHQLRGPDGTPLDLVHRDVSPQNVLLGYDGVARVTDFGIAKAAGQTSRTATGIIKGKLGYLAPELLRFEEPDRRSDLFALGVVLYELLAGKRLYKNRDGMDGLRRILHEPPPDILDERDDVPDRIVELLFSMLAKDPAQRPASARAVARWLDEELAEIVRAEGPIDVADHLAEHFGDHREAQRARLTPPAGAPAVEPDRGGAPPVRDDEVDTPPIVRGAAVGGLEDAGRRPSRRGAWAAGLAASVAAALAGWSWWGAPTPARLSPLGIEAPPLVTITIESDPSGAEVVIDTTPRGATPLTLAYVKSDRAIHATLTLEGFEPAPFQVTLDASQRLRLPLAAAPPIEANVPAASAPRYVAPPPTKAPPRIRRIGEPR